MKSNRKVVLYIAASLDGYIAKPGDDLSFLSIAQVEGEDYGYANFITSIDTVIIGRKTYDWVIKEVGHYPHADKSSYIITRIKKPDEGLSVFYTGNLVKLIEELKDKEGKNIFCDGGSEIVNELLKNDLIDELIISIIPVLVGNGIKLFKDGRPEHKLSLSSTKHFPSGLVQLHYIRQ